jgi:hypothetical protein
MSLDRLLDLMDAPYDSADEARVALNEINAMSDITDDEKASGAEVLLMTIAMIENPPGSKAVPLQPTKEARVRKWHEFDRFVNAQSRKMKAEVVKTLQELQNETMARLHKLRGTDT